jgi:hypothetical protein
MMPESMRLELGSSVSVQVANFCASVREARGNGVMWFDVEVESATTSRCSWIHERSNRPSCCGTQTPHKEE